ncbi:hypothetical protein V500_11368 [Pseudogymnoascus sp. VKM F-4518 (FW-2643)]|nr:hypothetical protein V500_11368 [Pseudogymnoascus sp. VKM F-4518 (FW-2643)]
MISVTNPFLASLFPSEEKILPWNYQITSDMWVLDINGTRNNPFFRTQFVQCSYPISGGYAPTLRYIFYVLAIASVVARKTSWAVTATLASVMTYSGVAAVHAFVLVIIRQKMVPKSMTDNYEVVLAEGISRTGYYEDATLSGPVWLPLLPMAWDNDCDPVLAIVGSVFLLLPIQIWSRTFRAANRTQRAIIYGWALVLLVGLISALVNRAYVDLWSFPQPRFCPNDHEDTLPLSNSGSDSIAGLWDKHDRYRWNKTIQDHFVLKDFDIQAADACLYPCFDFRWPLRDPEDIFVVIGSYGTMFETNTTCSLLVTVYVLVSCSGISSLTVLGLRLLSNHIPAEWRDLAFGSVLRKTREAYKDVISKPNVMSLYGIFALRLWILCITFYASILNMLALALMVVYTEWGMWVADPGGETFKHIGQCGPLVAAIFVIGAALIPGIISPTTTVKTDHDLGEDQTSGNGLRMDSLHPIPARPASAPCTSKPNSLV